MLASVDPFGAVEGGYFNASGKIQPRLVRELPDLIVPGRRTLYLRSNNSQCSILAEYYPDNSSKVAGSEFRVFVLYLGMYSTGQVVAMGIEPVDGNYNTYKRIGLGHTGGSGYKQFVCSCL